MSDCKWCLGRGLVCRRHGVVPCRCHDRGRMPVEKLCPVCREQAHEPRAANTGYEAAFAREGAGDRWVCVIVELAIIPVGPGQVECPTHGPGFGCVRRLGRVYA